MSNGPKPSTVKEKFDAAVSIIRSLPKHGPFQPSNTVKLRFYALYKQSTEGPCTLAKPSFWDAVGRAKWEAWTVCGKMSADLAMQMYMEELKQLAQTMPQSPEIEEFLKLLAPGDKQEQQSSEVVGGATAESGSGGGGTSGSGSGLEGAVERVEEGEDDGEKDCSSGQRNPEQEPSNHPEGEWSGNRSDSETSEDFQESFQVFSSPPNGEGAHQEPLISEPDSQSWPPGDEGPRRVTVVEDSAVPKRPLPGAEGNASMIDVVPRMLSIQSSLQSTLHQLADLVSSISPRPQPQPQTHPQPQQVIQVRWLRRRVLYRLVPFMLSWPFALQFIIRFLVRRYGSSSSYHPIPWWVFSLLTFLHTAFAVALLTFDLSTTR